MPASVKARFCAERNDLFIYLKFFADTYDYYYTVLDLRNQLSVDPFLAGLVAAGRELITLAASLLLNKNPNSKAAEAARFAMEIFLKTFLVVNLGIGEAEIKTYNHRLDKLLAKCLDVQPSSELRAIQNKIELFPEVGIRYRVENVEPRKLWAMYYAAQSAGTNRASPHERSKHCCDGYDRQH